MKNRFLETGKIVGTHGIKGEVRVQAWADSPEFLCEFDSFYLDDSGNSQLEVERSRRHKNIVIMKIKGVDSIEAAEGLRNKVLFMDREEVDIGDSYFIADLIGCRVFDVDTKELIGNISDVSQTGANDVWHITNDKGEFLIPVIEQVVIDVDIDNENIFIRPLPGIFDI